MSVLNYSKKMNVTTKVSFSWQIEKKNESRKEIRTEAGGVNRIECFTCFPLKMKES